MKFTHCPPSNSLSSISSPLFMLICLSLGVSTCLWYFMACLSITIYILPDVI